MTLMVIVNYLLDFTMMVSIEIDGSRCLDVDDAYDMFLKHFRLPDYFSFNLSSLDECLNDLSWFGENVDFEFTIKNHKSFVKNSPKIRDEILDILSNIDLNFEDEEKRQRFILVLN